MLLVHDSLDSRLSTTLLDESRCRKHRRIPNLSMRMSPTTRMHGLHSVSLQRRCSPLQAGRLTNIGWHEPGTRECSACASACADEHQARSRRPRTRAQTLQELSASRSDLRSACLMRLLFDNWSSTPRHMLLSCRPKQRTTYNERAPSADAQCAPALGGDLPASALRINIRLLNETLVSRSADECDPVHPPRRQGASRAWGTDHGHNWLTTGSTAPVDRRRQNQEVLALVV